MGLTGILGLSSEEFRDLWITRPNLWPKEADSLVTFSAAKASASDLQGFFISSKGIHPLPDATRTDYSDMALMMSLLYR